MTIKLIHFSSPTCSVCSTQEIVLKNINQKYSNIETADYPITTHFDEALRLGVKSAPTLVYLVDDRPAKISIGFQDEKKIESQLKIMGISRP